MQDPNDSIPQLDAMRMGVDYRFVVKARGFAMDARPLSVDETTDVTAETLAELSKVPDHLKNSAARGHHHREENAGDGVDFWHPASGTPR
jgi:hypothetical protein